MEEFFTEHLEKKRFFKELTLRIRDYNELRQYCSNILINQDFMISKSDIKILSGNDFDKVISHKKVRPVQLFLKSRKHVKVGQKYPSLWKIFLFLGIVLSAVYLFFPLNYAQSLVQLSIISCFIAFGVFFCYKETCVLWLWIKIVGLFDANAKQGVFRVLVAGDSQGRNVEDLLEDAVSEFYTTLYRSFIKVGSVKTLVRECNVSLFLEELNSATHKLDDITAQLTASKIDEEKFSSISNALNRKINNLRFILDLV